MAFDLRKLKDLRQVDVYRSPYDERRGLPDPWEEYSRGFRTYTAILDVHGFQKQITLPYPMPYIDIELITERCNTNVNVTQTENVSVAVLRFTRAYENVYKLMDEEEEKPTRIEVKVSRKFNLDEEE